MTSVHYAENRVGEVAYRYNIWYTLDRIGFRKLSLREVDDLWGSVDDGFGIFLFDLFSFSESALKILYLFLFRPKKPEWIRNQRRVTRETDVDPYPEPCHLVPVNRVLTLSNDGRFLGYRALLHPPPALCRIIC